MQWIQSTRVVVEANLGIRGETFVKVPQQLPELLIGNRIWVLLVPCVPYLGKPDPIEVGEDRPGNLSDLALPHESLGFLGCVKEIRWN